MGRSDIGSVLQYIRGAAEAEKLGGLPDRELLQRFVERHEEAAFAVLMQRHGPMVLGVCRRVLRQTQDAEDAFQATFLLLARGAGAIRNPDSVGGWLHGVALRAASKLRSKIARRPPATVAEGQTSAGSAASDPIDEATWKELRVVLDEELDQLPTELRVPLVLCYLEGRTQDEGARQLGWTRRVFRRRLEKGRARLARGLARRGVALSAALFAVMLSQEAQAMTAAMCAPVLRATVALAGERASGVSAAAWRLAETLVPSQVVSKGKLLLVLFLVVNMAAVAAGLVAISPAQRKPQTDPITKAQPKREAEMPAGVELLGATAVLRGCVQDASGQVVPHARLAVLAQRPYSPGEHGLRQDMLVQGEADIDGRFQLVVPADFPTWYAERRVVVVASATGHAPATLAVPLRTGQPNLALNLSPDRPLRGLLTDRAGKPVAGVQLKVVRLGSALREIVQGSEEGQAGARASLRPGDTADFWPAPATTNAQGIFEFPSLGTVRNVWLQIHDDRFAVSTFPAEYSDGRPIDGGRYGVGVVPGQVLEGIVTAADTGRPIPHAILTAVNPNEWTEAPRYELHTVAREVPRTARGLPTSLYWTPWLHTVAQEATSRAPCREFDGQADAEGRFRLRVSSGYFIRLEAHAPPGSPYMALSRVIDRRDDNEQQRLNFALPRGVLLTAHVHDAASGRPGVGAVGYYVPDRDNPQVGREVLHGCDAHAVSGPDGILRLAVPSGHGRLCVHAPDGKFLAVPYRVQGEAAGRVSYAHGIVDLDLPVDAGEAKADVPLREGVSITGKLIGPDGRPVAAAVLVSAAHVHPLNPATARPLQCVGGEFVLPGCDLGRTYRVLFLDAERRLGAVADLIAGSRETPTVVRLQPCGEATVRFADPDGRQLANLTVTPFVLLEPDVASDDSAALARRATEARPHEMAWADPLAYRHCLGPHTEADGRITLTGLVPGARYGLTQWDGVRSSCVAGPFTIRPGETLRLPDVTASALPMLGRGLQKVEVP
jgi:RNA polymerase sigma factor (sigma-70 family)